MNKQRGQGSLEYLLIVVIALTVVVIVMIFTQDLTGGVQTYDDLGLFEGAVGGGSAGGYSGGGLSGGGEDSDGDGIPDSEEINLGTKPDNSNSDGDGHDDKEDPFPDDPDNTGDEGDMAEDCNKLTSDDADACKSIAVCSIFDVEISSDDKCHVREDDPALTNPGSCGNCKYYDPSIEGCGSPFDLTFCVTDWTCQKECESGTSPDDSDDDGISDSIDECLNTYPEEIVNIYGCSMSDCLDVTCVPGTVAEICYDHDLDFNLICNSNGQHEYHGGF